MCTKRSVGDFLKWRDVDAKADTQLEAIVKVASESPKTLCDTYLDCEPGDSTFENVLMNAEEHLKSVVKSSPKGACPVPDAVLAWLEILQDHLALIVYLLPELDQDQPLFKGLAKAVQIRQKIITDLKLAEL